MEKIQVILVDVGEGHSDIILTREAIRGMLAKVNAPILLEHGTGVSPLACPDVATAVHNTIIAQRAMKIIQTKPQRKWKR